jgi:hypothetical protein
MKRFLTTSLAFVFVMSSFGHVLAAAFCPGKLGRECCFAKSAQHMQHSAAAEDMAGETMPMTEMADHCASHSDVTSDAERMALMPMDAAETETAAPENPSTEPAPFSQSPEAADITFDQPAQFCAHCCSHSGPFGLPLSLAGTTDHAGKDVGCVPLPVSRFSGGLILAFGRKVLPAEHGPPCASLPRYIALNVFLI